MGRDLALERAWRNRLRRHERSGLTVREFCEREDVAPHQFFWWRRELKQRSGKVPARKQGGTSTRAKPAGRRKRQNAVAAGNFVSIDVTPSRPTKAPIEIVLDHPLRIAVRSGFDAQLLSEVVRVLEAR